MTLSNRHKTVLFIKRFNCLSNKFIRSSYGNKLSSITTSSVTLPGLRWLGKHYIFDKEVFIAHPFSLMLHGKKRTTGIPVLDLEQYVGIGGSMETFKQGFSNIPSNVDCWTGFTELQDGYYCSLYFNLGRAFLHRFFGIRLPYTLPPTYEKLFSELK